MPLLEVSQSRKVSATIHLDHATAVLLDQYAAFIHANADRVIEQALGYVFTKDREFQEFLKSPEAAKASPTLRVRKAAQPAKPSQPAPAPDGGKKAVAVPSAAPNGSGGAHLTEARA
jgi:hypothetical protein